ncbi:hypothetical protein [Glaciihabitans arcticus]|nr:hypothetical protein [Glaciihabitans arcticus]
MLNGLVDAVDAKFQQAIKDVEERRDASLIVRLRQTSNHHI